MKIIEYDIATGGKQDFYTLWKTTRVDLRPRNSEGEILEHFRANSLGGNMYYHVHIKFVQNLAKTKEGAILKLQELGLDAKVDPEQFEFELKHLTKPSVNAFGASLKFKNNKWYAKATPEFFECWKENKEAMKQLGWSCWKYEDAWYMCLKTED